LLERRQGPSLIRLNPSGEDDHIFMPSFPEFLPKQKCRDRRAEQTSPVDE
jgi:hypothetical protein